MLHKPETPQAGEVAQWRKVERERLLASRMAMAAEERAQRTIRIIQHLEGILPPGGVTVSVYWPIRGEPDLREWMHRRATQGGRIALPVATELGRPLTFRAWHPGSRMARGLWKIPYPADGPEVCPEFTLAPVVGFDAAGFRLGYGGGFFDRTLAALRPRPLAIGIAYEDAAIASIFPQPHDIGMDWIVTDRVAPRQFPRPGS
jgi:5,10-methenyltetrahydrofolate synthetase